MSLTSKLPKTQQKTFRAALDLSFVPAARWEDFDLLNARQIR
jgi:hypothetical protein